MRLVFLLLLAACDFTPAVVTQDQVDGSVGLKDYKTACVGLKMQSDKLREHTAERIMNIDDPIVVQCVCDAIPSATDGWDESVVKGLVGAETDAIVSCLAAVVEKADLPRRAEAIDYLGRTRAPSGKAALARIAAAPGDAAIQAAAIKSLRGDPSQQDAIIAALTSAPEAVVRAAAADSLGKISKRDEAVVGALRTAISSDAEGSVRAAAVAALKDAADAEDNKLVCQAMLSDADPLVRWQAAIFFRGTSNDDNGACLAKAAMQKEDSPEVRTALLDAMRNSRTDAAAKGLCDAIPFWMRTYVTTALPENLPGTDIITAQNGRDQANSYACVEKAVRGKGYSCYARLYLATWFEALGGKTSIPKCPGVAPQ